MEKIYMEKNQNRKNDSFFKKLFRNDKSVFLSFVVAIVFIFSLVIFGFNQVSYAINNVEDPLPDSFTTSSGEQVIGESNPVVGITSYTTSDGIPVFCIQHDVPFCTGKSYQKSEDLIEDQGLIYLMANLYNGTEASRLTNKDVLVDIWLTQTAIWVYQKKIGAKDTSKITDTDVQNIYAIKKLYNSKSTDLINESSPLYTLYGIDKKIETAINIHNSGATIKTFDVSMNSDTLTITDDEKYYQTDLVSVVGSVNYEKLGSFEGFSVTLSSAPSGTILVNENGEQITNLDKMAVGTKFYIRIPVDKVTEDAKSIVLTATGIFKSYEGYYYTSDDNCQVITNVRTITSSLSDGLTYDINYTPEVPDTNKNVAQSIYFIGLIIMLSGVGVIYANVKPKAKQQ